LQDSEIAERRIPTLWKTTMNWRTTMNRNIWLYVIVAIACTAELRAQTSPPQQPAASSQETRPYVVIGCISRDTQALADANRGAAPGPRFIVTDTRGFIIMDTRGGRLSAYRLDDDRGQLASHVGHTLEITGPVWPWSEPPRLRVESLAYISKTCQQ
jgi:hypothetical protein